MPALSRVNTPAIVKTAPTFDHEVLTAEQNRSAPSTKTLEKTKSMASDMSRLSQDHARGKERKERKSTSKWRKLQGRSTGLEDLQRLSAANSHKDAPPAYGNDNDSELALPAPRFSESSRSSGSRGSSGDHQIYGSTTTTTHTIPSPDGSQSPNGPATPRASTSA
ncbi:15408_t:CDS:2, partial [Cetraspora pellucida]